MGELSTMIVNTSSTSYTAYDLKEVHKTVDLITAYLQFNGFSDPSTSYGYLSGRYVDLCLLSVQ